MSTFWSSIIGIVRLNPPSFKLLIHQIGTSRRHRSRLFYCLQGERPSIRVRSHTAKELSNWYCRSGPATRWNLGTIL